MHKSSQKSLLSYFAKRGTPDSRMGQLADDKAGDATPRPAKTGAAAPHKTPCSVTGALRELETPLPKAGTATPAPIPGTATSAIHPQWAQDTQKHSTAKPQTGAAPLESASEALQQTPFRTPAQAMLARGGSLGLQTPLGSSSAPLHTGGLASSSARGNASSCVGSKRPSRGRGDGDSDGGPSTEERRVRMRTALGADGTKEEEAYREVQTRFGWLAEKKARDGKGRRPSDPDYDPRTVSVPPGVWGGLSDSQRQYWQVKQHYRDVILFFKVGMFYELYEDDAVIGAEVLQWKMTVTGVGHCRQVGCPESGIEEAVARLTAAGYKVGRMEQVETAAQAKAARGPKACIIRRLTRIHTPATATGTSGPPLAADAVHLMALTESESGGTGGPTTQRCEYGFAVLDAAAGKVYVGTAADEGGGRACLGALLTQVAPREVLHARGGLSPATARLLAYPPLPLQASAVEPGDEFPDPDMALTHIRKQGFFGGGTELPPTVARLGGPALSALAALLLHLRRMKASAELITAAQVVPFELYAGGAMQLGGPTLGHLEVLEGGEGGPRGSLLARLDSCASPGGRRLLRRWLCRPLTHIPDIDARLDAVDELIARPALTGPLRAALRKLPDLERVIGRVRHAAAAPSKGLPIAAIQAAQCRRLLALGTAVLAIRDAKDALEAFGCGGDDSYGGVPRASVLAAAAGVAVLGEAPKQALKRIDESLVWPAGGAGSSAKGKSKTPVGPRLRTAQPDSAAPIPADPAAALEREIESTGELVAEFNACGAAWEALEGALSTLDVLAAFAAFAETADGPTCRPRLLPRPATGAFFDFSALWHPCATTASGQAPVPNDLTLGTPPPVASGGGPALRSSPAVVSGGGAPVAVGTCAGNGASLAVASGGEGGGGADAAGAPRALLLTGPNMGGKSTLLRAACTAVLLAQVGCYVPADSASLSPADRIFTRLGAHDSLCLGQSTFLVECSETASILRHATPDSLVVLDELGRGTSTFDGYAIAYAVLRHLSRQVDCRLLFATHYHPLTAEFEFDPTSAPASNIGFRVALGHMAALVGEATNPIEGFPAGREPTEQAQGIFGGGFREGSEDQRGVDGDSRCITFLYKLQPGACPKSYGLQVARLAGIPPSIVAAADQAGQLLEGKLAGAFGGATASLKGPAQDPAQQQSDDQCCATHSDENGVSPIPVELAEGGTRGLGTSAGGIGSGLQFAGAEGEVMARVPEILENLDRPAAAETLLALWKDAKAACGA